MLTQLFPSLVTGVQSSDKTSDIFLKIKLIHQLQIRNQQQDSHTDLRNCKTQSAQWKSEQRNGAHILLCAKRISNYPETKSLNWWLPQTESRSFIYPLIALNTDNKTANPGPNHHFASITVIFSQLPSYPTNSQDMCLSLGSHLPKSPCAASSLPYQVQASCHCLQGVLKCTLALPLLLFLRAVSPVMPLFVFFSHFTFSVLLLTLRVPRLLQDLFHSSCRLCLKTLWMSKQMSSQLVTATVQRQLKKTCTNSPWKL